MPYKALIVDGNVDNQLVASYALQGEGYEVQTAASGAEAIKLVTAWGPDLLVLEAVLPDCSGLELCRSLRKMPELAHLTVIMVSSGASSAECIAGLKAGADDYLAKPAGTAEFVARADALLARSARIWPRSQCGRAPRCPDALPAQALADCATPA